MSLGNGGRPEWLTFDCYGTLIQWDAGLKAVLENIIRRKRADLALDDVLRVFDRYEIELGQYAPFQTFSQITPKALALAFAEFEIVIDAEDGEELLRRIPTFPPFPEVPEALKTLKHAGFKLCIISNTDDELIAGNIAQLGSTIDHVTTAKQARSYKPSRIIFEHAWSRIGASAADVVHVCASTALDHTAARDLQFRCVWINRGTYRRPLSDYTADLVIPSLDRLITSFTELGWL